MNTTNHIPPTTKTTEITIEVQYANAEELEHLKVFFALVGKSNHHKRAKSLEKVAKNPKLLDTAFKFL